MLYNKINPDPRSPRVWMHLTFRLYNSAKPNGCYVSSTFMNDK